VERRVGLKDPSRLHRSCCDGHVGHPRVLFPVRPDIDALAATLAAFGAPLEPGRVMGLWVPWPRAPRAIVTFRRF
jgi:hypothetical protein